MASQSACVKEEIQGKGLNGDRNNKCLENKEKDDVFLRAEEGIAGEYRAFAV